MKKVLVILLIISNFLNSQTESLNNFHLQEDLSLNYIKIFNVADSVDINKVTKFIRSKSYLKNIKTEGNFIRGEIVDMQIEYQKYGGKYMTTLILLNHDLQANFEIELKDNRYRIIIKNLVFIDRNSLQAWNSTNSEINKLRIEDMTVNKRKSKFRNSNTISKGLEYCDKYFTDFFTYKITKSDW